jgi:hypothetical protein
MTELAKRAAQQDVCTCPCHTGNEPRCEQCCAGPAGVRELTAQLEAFKAAATLLIDYCEAHDWGTMPEPFASINPLLKLLGREEYKK